VSILLARQQMFADAAARLILEMRARGFVPKMGETMRAPLQAHVNSLMPAARERIADLVAHEFPQLASILRGMKQKASGKRSVHPDACAIDVPLFDQGGNLLGADAHEEFGLWWEAQGPLFCWGGRFGDANHYSVTPDGVRK